jgi:(E)-4-hydroxy-3-methylbut-2-enyl-diphosphate synthase
MKASNTQVMAEAYRLLVNKMEEEGMNYPLHLGVTEAGDGEDGRIKSSVGIGALLEDGLGDTIRVSLTEEPEFEIPVCKRIAARYDRRNDHQAIADISISIPDFNSGHLPQSSILNLQSEIPYDPFVYARRKTSETDKIGNHHVPVVILSPDIKQLQNPESLAAISYKYSVETDKWTIGDMAADFIYLGANDLPYALPGTLKKIFDYKYWEALDGKSDSFPLFTPAEYLNASRKSYRINFLSLSIGDITDELLEAVKIDKFCVIILNTESTHPMAEERRVFIELMKSAIDTPVIIKMKYDGLDDEDLTIHSASDIGPLFLDGMGDGVWIESDNSSLR